jgi:hypothetical protein
MNVVISSGHGKYVRGASGILDEVDEARRVVERVAEELRGLGVEATTYHDDISHSQNENLNRIVDFHNAQNRKIDVSVHFNCYIETSSPVGCEVLFLTQASLASKLSATIAAAGGFIDRGGKKRTDLFFLNNTNQPALLIEVCFVDSEEDARLYQQNFEAICKAMAELAIAKTDALLNISGKVSHFGGPDDMGVAPDEGLAFIYEIDQAPHLFLPYQPTGTTGLARRLNPDIHYVACRWDYTQTPRDLLLKELAQVRTNTGLALSAYPADWGPHVNTGRIADLSPGLMEDLGIKTDDEVQVIFPT